MVYHGTLRQSNMAMEHGPFIGDFPIKTSHTAFSIAMFDYQMVNRCLMGTVINKLEMSIAMFAVMAIKSWHI